MRAIFCDDPARSRCSQNIHARADFNNAFNNCRKLHRYSDKSEIIKGHGAQKNGTILSRQSRGPFVRTRAKTARMIKGMVGSFPWFGNTDVTDRAARVQRATLFIAVRYSVRPYVCLARGVAFTYDAVGRR